MEKIRSIAILTTGGTISSLNSDRGIKPSEGVINTILEKLGYENLVSADGKIKIEIVPFINKDSTNIMLADQAKMASLAFGLTEKHDGVVITHGTDTLQFTSAMLSIMLSYLKKPIVITGSMKTIEQEDSDAMRNLDDSITFAKSGVGGVFVVFHGKVMPGQWVFETKKNDGLTLDCITNIVAHVKNKKLRYNVPLNNQNILLTPSLETRYNSNIGTIVISPNDNIEMIVRAAEQNSGIILLSYGSVGIPSNYFKNISDIARSVPIVLSSQVPSVHNMSGGYEVNVMAKEAGILLGTGLYSFDYGNMANVLGMIDTEKDDKERYLNKFRLYFENNKNRMHVIEYNKSITESKVPKHKDTSVLERSKLSKALICISRDPTLTPITPLRQKV